MTKPNMDRLYEEVLAETEERFRRHRAEREAKQELVANGRLFDANPDELVERRLARLQLNPQVARAIVAKRRGGVPPPGGGAAADRIVLERVLGTNDLMSVSFLDRGVAAARSVARIHIKVGGHTRGYGTGFMVSPRLLLTNNHVLPEASHATDSKAEFNFQSGVDGAMQSSCFVALAPLDFFMTDRDLDFTLVAVRPELDPNRFGWLKLIEDQGKLMVGEWVNIIQHPNGEPKQLALRENQVIDELEHWLHYRTDTAPGSSGSPVFNDQWEVVGLHHSGVPEKDGQGHILTIDGQRWDRSMGEHRIAWKANEGARVSRIVARVKAERLTGPRADLRDQMFDAALPAPLAAERPEAAVPDVPAASAAATWIVQAGNTQAAAVWTLPLTLSVSLGSVQAQLPQPAPQAVIAPGAVPVAEDPELSEILATAAQARSRTYYDKGQDGADAGHYYQGLKTDVSGKKLFAALSKLVVSTHTGTPRYQPSRQVYPWVDLHPDLKLRSIYSGRGFEPEELIREDFRIARERAARARELVLHEWSLDPDRLALELEFLEASLPYNCEHVVPQSWFRKLEPMRGDLHHLFACESGCNSFRSNIPYYDFPDYEEAVRDDCGKRMDDDKFEPASGKGTVARATFYFLLRYPGQIGDEAGELGKERLSILTDWHDAFPPDAYERHRNAAIFAAQGNRNPFIDHPEWVVKTDFRQAFDN